MQLQEQASRKQRIASTINRHSLDGVRQPRATWRDSDVVHATMTTTEATFLADISSPSTAWNVSPVDTLRYCGSRNNETCYVSFARFVHMMDLVAVPIIIGVGVVGNVISFLVFTCTYLRRVSSSIYLAALAIVDTVYLCVLLFSWLVDVGIQVRYVTLRWSY